MSDEKVTTWWRVSIYNWSSNVELKFYSLDVVKETDRFLLHLPRDSRGKLQRTAKKTAWHSWHRTKRAALEEAFAAVDAHIVSIHRSLIDATHRIEAIKAALDALPDEEEGA